MRTSSASHLVRFLPLLTLKLDPSRWNGEERVSRGDFRRRVAVWSQPAVGERLTYYYGPGSLGQEFDYGCGKIWGTLLETEQVVERVARMYKLDNGLVRERFGAINSTIDDLRRKAEVSAPHVTRDLFYSTHWLKGELLGLPQAVSAQTIASMIEDQLPFSSPEKHDLNSSDPLSPSSQAETEAKETRSYSRIFPPLPPSPLVDSQVIENQLTDQEEEHDVQAEAKLITALKAPIPINCIKTKRSCLHKILTQALLGQMPELTPSAAEEKLKDVLRFTIVFNDDPPGLHVARIKATLNDLESLGYVVEKVKNYWPRHGDNYSGVNCVLRTPSTDINPGFIWELQFHTPLSARTNAGTHQLFEEYRSATVDVERKRELFDQISQPWRYVPVPEGIKT
ncbi:hypothetical protein AAMO2058_000564300 [Amorphochlora amoebiformis]